MWKQKAPEAGWVESWTSRTEETLFGFVGFIPRAVSWAREYADRVFIVEQAYSQKAQVAQADPVTTW